MKESYKKLLDVLNSGGYIEKTHCGGYRLIDNKKRVRVIQHRTIVSMKEKGLLNSNLSTEPEAQNEAR